MFKKFCQCFGIASVILAGSYGDFLGGGADVRMHVPFALTSVCMAQILDIAILALVLFLILSPVRRLGLYDWARLVLALLIPPYLLLRVQSFLPESFLAGRVVMLSIVWIAGLLLLRLRFPRWYKQTMRAASAVATFVALFAVWSVAQLMWVATWKPGPQEKIAAWRRGPQPVRQHPLIVWVLFDELSYDQVFEHRARDLDLPNFDALRGESTTFTNAQPIGYYTKRIVPSLFTGQIVDDFHYDMKNRFSVHYEGQKGFHPLTGDGTVFADAKQTGFRTAVVGWYNPYCTIYASALDDCFWTNHDKLDGPMGEAETFRSNVYRPLRQFAQDMKSSQRANRDLCNYDVQQRVKTHLDLEDHALTLLRTDQADFVFLHMATPHSPNIWSRIHDDYTHVCDSSYLDNLELADRVMGKILTTLKASPRWGETTLIVQGDHSWRVGTWEDTPTWTEEDDAASKGATFDPRPAVMIHKPGQTEAKSVGEAWSLMNVHTVLEQTLHGQPASY